MPIGLTAANVGVLRPKFSDKWIEATKRHEGQFNKMRKIAGHTNQYKWPLMTQDMTSVGNAVEGQAFPTPDNPVVLQPFVGYKVFHGALQITDVVQALATGDAGSFRAANEMYIKSGMRAAMRYREVTHYQDGTGVQGVLSGTVTAGTVTMGISPYDAVLTSRSTDRTSVNAGIWPGATYDIVDQTTLLVKGQVKVIRQNDPTSSGTIGNFTLAAPGFPAGCAVGDLVVWRDSFGVAYDGLSSLIDNDISGTFQGLPFSSNPSYSTQIATVSSGGGTGRALTPALIYAMLQGGVDKFGAGVDGDGAYDASKLEVLANPAMAIQFANIYQVTGAAVNQAGTVASAGTIRYSENTKKFGNSSLSMATPFGDVTLMLRSNCPQSVIFGVDYSQLAFIESRPLGWRKAVDGNFTPSQVAATNTAQLYEVGQPIIFDRRGCFKLLDITYSTTNSGS